MSAKVTLTTVFLLAVAACPSTGVAFGYTINERICIADLSKPPAFPKPAPIPVGCELVDCCPGCPGPGPLEWRINIDGKILTGAELRFEGLSGAELRGIKLDGNVRREGNRVLLRPGRSRITGVPYQSRERGAIGSLLPIAGTAGIQFPAAQEAARLTERITIQQFLGSFLVNNFDWRFVITPCQRVPVPPLRLEDRLRIQGIEAGDEVIVMLDARKDSGCHDGSAGASSEWVFSSSGMSSFENLLLPGSCNSELAIFSKKHLLHIETPVTTWTNSPGDVHTVSLQPLKDVDVHVWVPDDATLSRAQEQIDKARDLFIENRVGVRFVGNVRKLSDVTADSNPENVVTAGISSDGKECLQLAAIQAKPYYTAKTLNVYYVHKPFTGRNCAIKPLPLVCTSSATAYPPGDANMTFIGTLASPTTLAHELGHAYGLRPALCGGHTESLAEFGPENIMAAGGGDERVSLSLGQVFRMHTHTDAWGGTMLIPNNLPSNPGRPCAPNITGPACPALELNYP